MNKNKITSPPVLSTTSGKAKRKTKSVAMAPQLSALSLSQSNCSLTEYLESYELTKDLHKDLTFLFSFIDVTVRITAGRNVSGRNDPNKSVTGETPEADAIEIPAARKSLQATKSCLHLDVSMDSHNTTDDNSFGRNEKQRRNDEIESSVKHNDVKEISIRHNCINVNIAKILSKSISKLTHLTSLTLWNAGLEDESLRYLGQSLSSLTTLEKLCLDGNGLVTGQKFHMFLLQSNQLKLKHFSLKHCRITEIGACYLSEALSNNQHLLTLNLCFNKLGDNGAEYLANCLRCNRTLLSLDLGSNGIGDKGVKSIAGVLRGFPMTEEETVTRRQLQGRYKNEEYNSEIIRLLEEKRNYNKLKIKEKREGKGREVQNRFNPQKVALDGEKNVVNHQTNNRMIISSITLH